MSGNPRDLAQSADCYDSHEVTRGSASEMPFGTRTTGYVSPMFNSCQWMFRINLLVHFPKRTLDHECLGGFHSGRVSLRVQPIVLHVFDCWNVEGPLKG